MNNKDRSRASSSSSCCSFHLVCRSIHIVALGSECPTGVGAGEEVLGQGQLQGGLLWSYLGHSALVGPCDLENSLHNPAFMEYTSRVFGDVTVVVRDCPSWVRDMCRTGWMRQSSTLICSGVLCLRSFQSDWLPEESQGSPRCQNIITMEVFARAVSL